MKNEEHERYIAKGIHGGHGFIKVMKETYPGCMVEEPKYSGSSYHDLHNMHPIHLNEIIMEIESKKVIAKSSGTLIIYGDKPNREKIKSKIEKETGYIIKYLD